MPFESESNDSVKTADSLSSGEAISGQLSASTDVDYYKLSASSSGSLEVNLDTALSSFSSDAYTFTLYDNSNNILGSYTGNDMTVAMGIPMAGSYFLKIANNGYSHSSEQYSLKATLSSDAPVIISTTHRSSILVDAGVVSGAPIIFDDLIEKIERTNEVITKHVFSYDEKEYNYESISSLILVVVRDNEFTEEFRSELADFAPEFKDISYNEAVAAVGLIGISDAIIAVAGSDGSYLS